MKVNWFAWLAVIWLAIALVVSLSYPETAPLVAVGVAIALAILAQKE